MDELYIGRIATTHGVRGMVKVFPTTDDIKRFEQLKQVTLELPTGQERIVTITSVKYLNQFVLLAFEEVTDMNQAILLKQSIIKIPKEKAIPLKKNEYYVMDLMGLDVYEEGGTYIGPIIDVIFTGSNEVYVIKDSENHELLLPAIKECILSVDMEKRRMDVHVMEGLREL